MERHEVADRQFDALLERLDRIAQQLEKIDRRLEAQEGFALISKELRSLEESLNALAFAALGQTPRVRRQAS
jgi:DNA-binding FrmR family transcriptional regulator